MHIFSLELLIVLNIHTSAPITMLTAIQQLPYTMQALFIHLPENQMKSLLLNLYKLWNQTMVSSTWFFVRLLNVEIYKTNTFNSHQFDWEKFQRRIGWETRVCIVCGWILRTVVCSVSKASTGMDESCPKGNKHSLYLQHSARNNYHTISAVWPEKNQTWLSELRFTKRTMHQWRNPQLSNYSLVSDGQQG